MVPPPLPEAPPLVVPPPPDDAPPTVRFDRYSNEYARYVWDAATQANRPDILAILRPSLTLIQVGLEPTYSRTSRRTISNSDT